MKQNHEKNRFVISIQPQIIESKTERLFLRQWCHSDYDFFAQLNADSEVMEFFPSTLKKGESDQMAQRIQSLIHQRGWGLWALETRKKNQFIGFTGLHIPQENLPFYPCIEIGWRLSKEHWGKGYATEAAKEALKIGFEILKLNEIVSFTSLINQKSRLVMERLQMKNINQNFEHPDLTKNHVLSPHCLYKITKQHWKLGKNQA